MHWRSVRIKQTIVSGDGWSFRKIELARITHVQTGRASAKKNRHQKNATNFTNKQERKQKTTQRSVKKSQSSKMFSVFSAMGACMGVCVCHV